jgi:hypothetical protein
MAMSLKSAAVLACAAGALSLVVVAGTSAQGVTFYQTGAAFNNPIGVAYNAGNSSLIVTTNYPTGNPNSFSRIDIAGNTTPYSPATGFPDERYLDCPRPINSISGWTVGETFAGNGQVGQIARINAAGNTVTNTWVTLPGETGYPEGQLRFDNTGLFNNDLIVTCTSGNVWRVKANGVAILLATLPAGLSYEGLAVVPSNPTRYGPLSGRIIVGTEQSTTLWTIDNLGNVNTLTGIAPAQVEALHIIPANENFVGVNYGGGNILWANASDFSSYVGDILVVSEIIGANPGNTSGLSRLIWNGSGSGGSFQIVPIPLNPGSIVPTLWEGSTFAPAIPAPGAGALLGAAAVIASRRRR